MAAKKTSKSKAPSKKTAKAPVNKSQFIRENASLAPGEIVAKAEKQGIVLSINMVYTILSEYRKKQGTPPSKGKSAPAKPSATLPKVSGSAESQFGALILKLGTDRARELFDTTLAKVQKSIG